jgi:hypothetical protein
VELTRAKRTGTYDVRVSGGDGRLLTLARCQTLIVGPEILPASAG